MEAPTPARAVRRVYLPAAIRAAYTLYGGILDEVERAGFDVLRGRVSVPRRRRAVVALRELGPGRRLIGGRPVGTKGARWARTAARRT